MKTRGRHHGSRTPPGPQGGGPAPVLRFFGEGEDPLTWSFPIGRYLGVPVRVHYIVPMWAGAEVIASSGLGSFYLLQGACAVGAFILLALVRELAKVVLARGPGADVAPIILWPLGGVTPVAKSRLGKPIAAQSGGLVAGMILWPLLAVAAWLVGLPWSYLSISPFNPMLVPSDDCRDTLLRAGVWWLYYANMLQVLLNLLVPMLPFDAGRILFAGSAARRGPGGAAELVGRAGAVGAVALLIVGSTADQSRLIAVAVIGFLATVSEVRRVQFAAGGGEPPRREARDSTPVKCIRLPIPSAPTQPAPTPDEVLGRIARDGIVSLTPAERRILEAETRRRNGPSSEPGAAT